MNKIIEVTVANKKITYVSDRDAGASETFGVVFVKFTFDSEWDNLIKYCTFRDAKKGTPVDKILDAENKCEIPWEALLYEGKIHFNPVGLDAGGTIRAKTKREFLEVSEALKSGNASQTPTPNLLEQHNNNNAAHPDIRQILANIPGAGTTTTDGVPEGLNNLYFTIQRVTDVLTPVLVNYYTSEQIDFILASLVGLATPENLNTLYEIANAMNNDPEFATTVFTALAGKVDKVTGKSLLDDLEITRLAGIITGTVSIPSSATPTPDATKKQSNIILTEPSQLQIPSGNPFDGQDLLIRIKATGGTWNLTYNGIYRAINVTMPATVAQNKIVYLGCKYNAADTKWDVLAVGPEA